MGSLRFLVLVLALTAAACQTYHSNAQSMSSPAAGPQVGMNPEGPDDSLKAALSTW